MAAEGELAEPRVPAPNHVRPVMGFSRLSAAAYTRLREAVDRDDEFRARVAAEADEEIVGRAGYLWLTRPDGWDDDPVFAETPKPHRPATDGAKARELAAAEAKLDKLRTKLDQAEAARRRAQEDRTATAAELRRASEELAALRTRVDDLEADRNAAIRTQKALEADLAETRRDLRLAREAAREAEAEVLELRGGTAGRTGSRSSSPGPDTAAGGPGVDVATVRDAVRAATDAADTLSEALQAATGALGPGPGEAAPAAPSRRAVERRPPVRTERRRRARRTPPALPPGVFADSAEAHRHLVTDPGVTVVVDGYNLARAAWTGLEPEEERRRTVALLEETAIRSGATIVVVFDGDDLATAPAASRVVRVRFSATGVTADDHIAAMLGDLPVDQPVVVVSTDRAVADDARRQGAAVLSSVEFLAAVGR